MAKTFQGSIYQTIRRKMSGNDLIFSINLRQSLCKGVAGSRCRSSGLSEKDSHALTNLRKNIGDDLELFTYHSSVGLYLA
jgi:hypothetical protein